ncbi:MAG: uracil-DNA glycosylase [Epsilonproteobacteria bacterium]|nr:uracil-DNA glycosylase [Campylobacterota bacterium]
MWISKLNDFYLSRKEYINFANVDYTNVYDKTLHKTTDNPIMIVGEAPGKNEVLQQQPFVGKAGENLNYLISISRYDRDRDFLITNAFPFRTYRDTTNRTPSAKELKVGAKLLLEEIKIVRPRLILLLGNSAVRAFSYLPIPNAKDIKCFTRNILYDFDIDGLHTQIGISYHPSPISFNRPNIKRALEYFFKEVI